ncbi:MAG: T9SS type A sorting domain-containing protein [Lewinellaceae bacterium]|nr:T9SS type A sorting domain-containing protein [Lewinellaceae bacterium]
MYPNPTTGLLTWRGASTQFVLLRLYSHTGELQMKQMLTGSAVQIGHLPDGLYQVQLFDAQSKSLLTTQKVLLIKH